MSWRGWNRARRCSRFAVAFRLTEHHVVASRVAPVIAKRLGARRAGQDRAAPKGSLDAPKRSPTIERRSDGDVLANLSGTPFASV